MTSKSSQYPRLRIHSQQQATQDSTVFSESYLTSGNPDIAQEYLWPVPVFKRLKEAFSVQLPDSSLTIEPGDVLEYCGGTHEEYNLVIALLPAPAGEHIHTLDFDAVPKQLLTYSSNADTYRTFSPRNFYRTDGNTLFHSAGEFRLHKDTVETIGLTDEIADVSNPPGPIIEEDERNPGVSFPHSHETITINPERPTTTSHNRLDSLPTETVLAGDAKKVLGTLPTDSIDTWVTSPPYHRQRSYTNLGDEIGSEETVDEYVESIIEVVLRLMRVLKPTGIGWLVIDDSYTDGELSLAPQRLALELQQEGYKIVHQSPWIKSDGGKPDPTPSRFSQRHEKVLCLTHPDADRWFTPQAADTIHDVFRAPTGNSYDTDHSAVFSESLVDKMIRATCPPHVCSNCGTPHEPVYEVTDILNLPTGRQQAESAIETAQRGLKEGTLTRKHLHACRSVGLGDTGLSADEQDGTGKNAADTERLYQETREYFDSHGRKSLTREFTNAKKELTGHTKKCLCNTDKTNPGTALDPFIGSGTAAVVSQRLGRQWIGIELDPDRAGEAQARALNTPAGSELNAEVPNNESTPQTGLEEFN
jgi:hypothetical protein